MFVRSVFFVTALLCFAAGPLVAQQYCDLYVQEEHSWSNSSADLDVAAFGSCERPQTQAYAKVTLPSGASRDASGSGASYAEAFASIPVNGETGIGSFSGYGDVLDQCWEDSYRYIPFSLAFRLNDPAPSITGVNPGSWSAGTSTSVHISGTGFGSCPSLSITDSYNAITFSVSSSGNTWIDANVNIAASTPAENATVTVTSNGYNCQGFFSNQGSSPAAPQVNLPVNPIPAPVPQICFDSCGTNIANTTQSFVVGQHVALATSVSVPPGLAITSQSWTVPGLPGTAVAGLFGFNPGSPPSGGVIQLLTVTNPSISFYWVTSGISRQVTYTYCLNNNQCNTAGVTFNVDGPTGLTETTTHGGWEITSTHISFSNPDMTFEADASFPTGSGDGSGFTWVQIMDNFVGHRTFPSRSTTCGPVSGLDGAYPYRTGTFANDGPGAPLISDATSVDVSISFRLYLLWQPSLPNSIPVPLGYVNWSVYGKANNSGGTWSEDSSSTYSASSFVTTPSYPSWSNVVIASNITCQ